MDWQRAVFCCSFVFSCSIFSCVCVISCDKAITQSPENSSPTKAERCDKSKLTAYHKAILICMMRSAWIETAAKWLTPPTQGSSPESN